VNAKEAKKRLDELKNGEALLHFLNLPVVGLVNGDVPMPDLIFNREVGDRVGIEVTKVFEHNLPAQKVEQEKTPLADGRKGTVSSKVAHDAEVSQLVNFARQLFIEQGGPPLHVSIRCNNQCDNRKDRNVNAKRIADWVLSNVPSVNKPTEWSWGDSAFGSFPPCVSSIDAFMLASSTEHYWNDPLSYFANPDLLSAINYVQAAKEPKLSLYESEFVECWLLIVADWESGASSACFEIHDDLKLVQIHSAFQRIFFLDNLHGRVAELQLCQ